MTGPDDDVTAAPAHRFRQHPQDAPDADGLPEKTGTARRRGRRVNASIAAIAVLVVGVPVAVVATVDRSGPPSVAAEIDPTWRWESYRGVQVPVPPDWGHGVPGPAWCAAPPEGESRTVRPGAVGRPGPMYLIKCATDYPPATERENWLTFDRRDREGERRLDHGWVEETRRVNGVYVTVLSNDDQLRSAILGSARTIQGTDENGCPVSHPVVTNPGGYRPDTPPPTGAVESISVCRYSLEEDVVPPLLGTRRVTGTAAKDAMAAIRSAPEGEGPDTAGDSDSHGAEIVVLRIGTSEVVVRYSGSTRNGFDDGTTRRRLTAESVHPLLTGAVRPSTIKIAVAGLFDE